MWRWLFVLLAGAGLLAVSCADDTPEVLSSNEQGASITLGGQTYTFDLSNAMCVFDGHRLNVQGAGTTADGRSFFVEPEGKDITLAMDATDFNSTQASADRWQATVDYAADLDTAMATTEVTNPSGEPHVGSVSVTCGRPGSGGSLPLAPASIRLCHRRLARFRSRRDRRAETPCWLTGCAGSLR